MDPCKQSINLINRSGMVSIFIGLSHFLDQGWPTLREAALRTLVSSTE